MPGFLDLPVRFTDPARIVVIPVAYDRTSTWRKGADKGPEAIIRASAAVEWLDIQTGTEVHLCGIATAEPIIEEGPPEALAERVDAAVARVLEQEQLPVLLGGEHSVSIGAFKACARRFDDLTILQIDAHADTRETYEGSPYNHACVMARARELCPIVQVGIRSLCAEELAALDQSRVIFAHDISPCDDAWIERAGAMLTEHVYITIDLDGLDPSLVPATGTPEPGGLSWRQCDALLQRACAGRRIVGFDVVELCPQPGAHASEFVAAKLTHRLMSLAMAGQAP